MSTTVYMENNTFEYSDMASDNRGLIYMEGATTETSKSREVDQI